MGREPAEIQAGSEFDLKWVRKYTAEPSSVV